MARSLRRTAGARGQTCVNAACRGGRCQRHRAGALGLANFCGRPISRWHSAFAIHLHRVFLHKFALAAVAPGRQARLGLAGPTEALDALHLHVLQKTEMQVAFPAIWQRCPRTQECLHPMHLVRRGLVAMSKQPGQGPLTTTFEQSLYSGSRGVCMLPVRSAI